MQIFRDEFTTLVDIVEHHGETFAPHPKLLEDAEGDTDEEKRQALHDKWLAMLFMRAANPRRFGALMADLKNFYGRGRDQWPADLTEAYSMLVDYEPPLSAHAQTNHASNTPAQAAAITGGDDNPLLTTGMTFAPAATPPVAGADGTTIAHITCFKCTSKGYYAENCPTKSVTVGTQHVQLVSEPGIATDDNDDPDLDTEYGCTFATVNSHLYNAIAIPKTWLLLDSQSTVSIFCNTGLLNNIRPSDTTLKVFTNGGTQDSTMIGDITNFGTVWYNPASMANILSQKVCKVCRVTMDSDLELAMIDATGPL
jgi:hypothetical protein